MSNEVAEPVAETGADLYNAVAGQIIPNTKVKTEGASPEPTELEGKNEEQQTPERSKIDKSTQAQIDKRIAKEVRKTKLLQAELAKEKARSQALEGQVKQTEGKSESKDLGSMSPEELELADKEARQYLVWAQNGPIDEGYEGKDENGQEKFYSAEEIKELYNLYHSRVMMDIPEARAKHAKIHQELAFLAENNEVLQNPDSIEYKTFKEVWNSPEFASMKQTGRGAEYAWAIARGKLSEVQTSPQFIPPPAPTSAPPVPTATAPAKPKATATEKSNGLTQSDFERAGKGDLTSIVSKLLN